MVEIWQIAIGLLVVLGALFCVVAALGVVRFPDTLTRMHASSKAGTVGCALFLLAVAAYFATGDVILRAGLGILFLLITTPISAHMIGRATHASRDPAQPTGMRDDLKASADDPCRRLQAGE